MLPAAAASDAIIAATVANYRAYFQGFACLPHCEYHEEDDCTWFLGFGAPGNVILRSDFTTENAEARVAEVLAQVARRVHSIEWLTEPAPQPPHLAQILQARGLTPEARHPVMTVPLTQVAWETPVPAELRIEPVRDEATLQDWLIASAAGYEAEMPKVQPYYNTYACLGFAPEGAFQHFVGYFDTTPVTSSTLLLAGGLAGIYDVSTAPQMRHRGCGTAITLACLRMAAERGYHHAVLQASEEGEPLYRRLGFATRYYEANYRWSRS